MAKISKIEPETPTFVKRKRVAAYARVSRDTERLLHSVSAQVSYYSKLIQDNPEWEYAGVYADSGISGTGVKARDEFRRMVSDCEAGKIDIVLTKSISRFARNTVDLLATVRRLKGIGVEVRFEKEHISSFSGDGELMMTILASFAQEESRSISENCKWGIRKRFQSGEIGVANKHILGYQYDEEQKKYVIIPGEAESVRWMFQMYIDGVSLRQIADNMNKAGIRTTLGNDFHEASVRQLIFNEVYAGDIRRQKCFIADPITKSKVKNRGELPQYYMTGCHEAIIDRDTYAKVLAEMERRAGLVNPAYPFTGKIKCSVCGNTFTRKKGTLKGKTHIHWICRSKKEVGQTCASINFSEGKLEKISAQMMGLDVFDGKLFADTVRQITVEKSGDLRYQFSDGSTNVWKNLNLHPYRHKVTVTDCFQGKIICAHCGNTYHRVVAGNRWVYWYCMGKKKKSVECHSINYADFQLRRILASILGLRDFSESEFDANIEKIMVLEDGSLECHFYEGEVRTWQRM